MANQLSSLCAKRATGAAVSGRSGGMISGNTGGPLRCLGSSRILTRQSWIRPRRLRHIGTGGWNVARLLLGYDIRAGIDWFACHAVRISDSRHDLERSSGDGVPWTIRWQGRPYSTGRPCHTDQTRRALVGRTQMRPMGFRSSLAGLENTRTAGRGTSPPMAVLASNPRRDGIFTGAGCVSVALNSGRGVARGPRLWITKEDGARAARAGSTW